MRNKYFTFIFLFLSLILAPRVYSKNLSNLNDSSNIQFSDHNIYEAYRNNAQYKKALNLLKNIIKNDPDNDTYYVELKPVSIKPLSSIQRTHMLISFSENFT